MFVTTSPTIILDCLSVGIVCYGIFIIVRKILLPDYVARRPPPMEGRFEYGYALVFPFGGGRRIKKGVTTCRRRAYMWARLWALYADYIPYFFTSKENVGIDWFYTGKPTDTGLVAMETNVGMTVSAVNATLGFA